MKKSHFALIIAVILLPVIIGIVLSISDRRPSDAVSLAPGGKKIGLVRLTDVIYESDGYVKQLSEFRKDNSIAAVILRINSPGGTVAPSQEIYSEAMNFRQSKKPLVISMENVAASGGYYIASAGSRVFANPGTLTGSIGVYMRFPYWQKLFEKVGVDMITIKAGKFKDVGNPNRPMTDQERAYLQDVIDDTHRQFIDDVARARSLDTDSVRRIADGRIFTGSQALRLKLVDTLGTYEDAVDYVKALCKLPEKTRIVEKSTMPFWKSLLLEETENLFGKLLKQIVPHGLFFLYDY
jgi:protease-4